MSYLNKIEYEIVMEESFVIIRNCAGCGRKTLFRNTEKFRVNANGNKVDVWLIYQCENCKHTCNLTIYERQKPTAIPTEEYRRFLENDEELAKIYGRNLQFFKRNKADVHAQGITFHVEKRKEERTKEWCSQQILLAIHNPGGLKLRPEKQIAEALGLSRSQVKRLLDREEMKIQELSGEYLSVFVDRNQILGN